VRFVVEAKGNAQLRVRSEDGTTDKLLTDVDLKRVSFSNDGDVKA
jgi:hypothetical protein